MVASLAFVALFKSVLLDAIFYFPSLTLPGGASFQFVILIVNLLRIFTSQPIIVEKGVANVTFQAFKLFKIIAVRVCRLVTAVIRVVQVEALFAFKAFRLGALVFAVWLGGCQLEAVVTT